ncbi:MAG: DUF3089 domain-containing protein [Sphingomicrobium sp.]
MRVLIVGLSGLALALPAPAAAQPVAAVDYSKESSWLCLPGRNDICAVPLATTELPASGYAARTTATPAVAPPIDCFYAYPTVSHDPGLNSDLIVSASEESAAAQNQLARFGQVCRTFAPIYRQMTIGAITAVMTGGDVSGAARTAYGDVSAAWHQFLKSRNGGRPFVLIGHSQGSLLLQQLIANEIEGRPEANRMLLAIIPGYNLVVPQGKLVGGSFKSTPLCSRSAQAGCVLAWTSYRIANIPPEGALFGYAARPGMTVACTNPARPGATGWADLSSYWTRGGWPSTPGGPVSWSSEGPPPTPFLHTPGLVSARCVNDGQRGYLSIRTNRPGPGGKRTDRIGGEVGLMGFFLPGWGMHLNDIAEAQGDLIERIRDVTPR